MNENKRYIRTNQREIILEFLRAHDGHYTAADIYEHVQKTLPRISKATVYKVLRLLVEKKDVYSFHVADTELFEGGFYGRNGPHDHFVCTICHGIEDIFTPEERNNFLSIIKKAYPDKEIGDLSVVVTGICKSCQSKRGEQNGKIE